ncbi:hypothetical protein DCM79_14900 [Bradyrhizobium sp. WBOS07]|uniref:Uncharacterized protein n=1 Tax=Bradyrhizobium betae TaxID=244734 RepID=A0AAE9NB43_9BRAD|nr:hypothetical protein DCM79_14900 [Bradyrhizobium sp. WBOS07]UUO68152.1 hypothetical protein DCM83_25010 [Bradyrhizobium betae]
MKVIKGIIGASEAVRPRVEMFRRRRCCNNKLLGNRAFKEGIHILLEPVQRAFTWSGKAPIMRVTARDEFPSQFNAMR